MFYNLALLTGVILALMNFFNSKLSSTIGIFPTGLVFHLLGLILIVAISIIKKNEIISINKISPKFLLPGLISVLVTVLNVLAIPKIGVTLATGVSLYSQFITSAIIENFGLFGIEKKALTKEKFYSYSIITIGVILMITL